MTDKVLKSCVSVDPSINNCGIALFFDNVLTTYDLLHPSKEYIDSDFMYKARDMFNKVRVIYKRALEIDPKTVLVTEVPEHFGTKGYIARETGSVYKLTFVCGMIYGITDNVVGYKPSKWKGQVSKEVTRNRLIRDYPDKDIENLDHNIVDAIGIGCKYIFGG